MPDVDLGQLTLTLQDSQDLGALCQVNYERCVRKQTPSNHRTKIQLLGPRFNC